MLDLRASAIDDYQRLIKRAFDLVIGLIALVPALPLMAMAALMMRMTAMMEKKILFFRLISRKRLAASRVTSLFMAGST